MNYLATTHKKGYPDYYLLAAVLFLMVIGIVIVYSSSSTVAFYNYNTPSYFMKRQIIKLVFSIVLMLILLNIDYSIVRTIAPVLLIISFILLAALLLGFNSTEIKGSRRWFSFSYFNFQPSELMKFSLIIYIAMLIEKKGERIIEFMDGFMPPFTIYFAAVFLIFLEPDLSTSLLISLIVFLILFLGGIRKTHLIAGGSFLLSITAVQVILNPYQLNRIKSFFSSDSEQSYQISQSLIAIGNGGITGQGLGNSQSKNLFIPEPFTDFIFAIFSEEWGFIGVFLVLSIFLFVFFRGLKISSEAPDKFGKLVAAGITFSLTFYALINAGVVCKILPTTGLPMPFISYGGSSLMFSAASVGLLLNISKNRSYPEKSKIVYRKNRRTKK